jgi:hypothetical protein
VVVGEISWNDNQKKKITAAVLNILFFRLFDCLSSHFQELDCKSEEKMIRGEKTVRVDTGGAKNSTKLNEEESTGRRTAW